MLHGQRVALPVAVGDGCIHPQASGKRWGMGGRACRLQVVLVLSTGRGPRPAATGGSARLAQHARWARGGRTARRVLAPPAPARGDPHIGQPQLAADQASGARRGED
ncbi:hypothetical protein BRM21_21480 [Xanthomonas oryzae pv. oryzae]|nr:hypothetical protein BRM21_21480 [Xanthomonas oryzae pv. oryzae]RBG90597.1 hypothetical protein BRM18_06560 [Xanthomonas oryzae pv. oryzae]RBH10633.1 hypothetical protein BRM25_20800 [Xanthomonas oryzae pv. oryzae]RBJ12970.1 hypothetical protein BRO18_21940 [Xanthomonas oryzae pv. oryzae]RBJ29976.1 hypothetical protein BRO19_21950 [Xanthomonas oryzae pv. oryzae]